MGTLVLPKIHSVQDLQYISDAIARSTQQGRRTQPLRLVASIESAKSLWNIGEIAAWTSPHGPLNGGTLNALLFAAEDCE